MTNNAINNKVGNSTNTSNFEIEKSASGLWIGLNDQTDTFGFYNNAGSPEAVVAANIGSYCVDTTNGDLYMKTTDTVNTGWELVPRQSTGVWTPVLTFGGGTTGITYGQQLGTYTRIGSIVISEFRILLTSKGTDVGAAIITGLPFACNATIGAMAVMAAQFIAVPGYSYLTSQVVAGATSIQPQAWNAPASTIGIGLDDSHFTNTTFIQSLHSYRI